MMDNQQFSASNDSQPRISIEMIQITSTRLLVIGIVFHAIYAWSIFDIYFRSPLVHGMTPVEPPQPAPAKRLVLAVADGLRADKLYEHNMALAPFLRTKVLEEGSWGVSHTRVPTESRPGHVALIAGFYEDVSAVTKGWKMNPVNFDSVFNQSRYTWAFGSPDILPMFAYGASEPDKIKMFMYEAETEDFAKEDASLLDVWVFDHFDALLDESLKNETLSNLLNSDRIVIFLHLLGLDTNGHGHKPFSREYLDNIRLVDSRLKTLESRLSRFYGDDGKTAFVFSADHGMNNRGAHGDGHPDNTQTPLIAWGAGIAKPNSQSPTGHDALSRSWNLSHVQRKDVNQADIAPLMASLVGVPYPLNSMGVLPIDYLDNSEEYKAQAVFANAKQILAQFLVKAEAKRRTELIFKSFSPLTRYKKIVSSIEQSIKEKAFATAELESTKLITLCIDGLRYYQTYDWLFLRSVISLGYVGWIVFSVTFILIEYLPAKKPSPKFGLPNVSDSSITSLAFAGLGGMCLMLCLKDSPAAYYLYVLFPIYFWSETFKKRQFIRTLVSSAKQADWWKAFGNIFGYIAFLEVLVSTYFQRSILTVCLILLALIWPLFMPLKFRETHSGLIWLWRSATLSTSTFMLFSVELESNVSLVLTGCFLVFVSGVVSAGLLPRYASKYLPGGSRTAQKQPEASFSAIIVLQLGILLVSGYTLYTTTLSLEAKEGLPFINSLISWTVLGLCILIPALDGVSHSHHYMHRLTVIYLAFAPVYMLLTVSYEFMFYFCFSMTLLAWIQLERELYVHESDSSKDSNYHELVGRDQETKFRPLRSADTRIASFFLLFINVGFFGTGNIASVSSFSIESVYRFITVFDPFVMGALLMFKILVPLFLLSSAFGILSRMVDLPSFSLFLLVLSTSDVMTLNFFFLVRDNGSWLEIGTTISHFMIASLFIVFQILLFSISHLLVGNVLIPKNRNTKKRR